MCYVGVVFKGDSLLRFKDLASNSKQYLLKLPFVLLSAPDETAADQNPTVLSMVRGGDTFAIGSGSDGTNPYASWFATTHPAPDDTNLKNLFDFSGDISLFGTNDAIDDIVAVKPGETPSDPGATPSPDTTYYLSSDKTLKEDKFKAETKTYYVSVPNETEQIRMDVSSSEKPTVTVNSASVNVTASDAKKYSSDLFDLAELDKTVNDGYNNTVTITAGGTTYTVYIRRLLKPKIILNPGNSPYGLIQQDDVNFPTQTDKDEAKKAFNDSHTTNKKFAAGKIPTGGQTTIAYTTVAWEDYDTNYDMVDETMFVYEASSFHDVGVKVFDELGDEVNDATINEQFTAKVMAKTGVPSYSTAETKDQIFAPTAGVFDLSGKIIRPDVYFIEYEYNYIDLTTKTNKTIKAKRPICVLSERGDAPGHRTEDGHQCPEHLRPFRSHGPRRGHGMCGIQIRHAPVGRPLPARDHRPRHRRAAPRRRSGGTGHHHPHQGRHPADPLPHPRPDQPGLHSLPLRPHPCAPDPHPGPQRRHAHHPRRQRLPAADRSPAHGKPEPEPQLPDHRGPREQPGYPGSPGGDERYPLRRRDPQAAKPGELHPEEHQGIPGRHHQGAPHGTAFHPAFRRQGQAHHRQAAHRIRSVKAACWKTTCLFPDKMKKAA